MKSRCWLLLSLLFPLSAPAQAPAVDENPNTCYNRGVMLQNKGDYAGAIAAYDQAIELQPDFAQAYGNRAGAKVSRGEYDSAILDYDKALELRPSDNQARFNRGVAQQGKGDFDAAIADYTKVLAVQPTYAKAFYNRGNAHEAKGDFAAAIADYDQAIHLKGDFFQAYNNRGNARQAQGDFAAAVADYNKAIELRPDMVVAYDSRGNAHQGAGDYEAALADFDKCLALSRNDAAYTRIARALLLARLHRGNPLAELAGEVGGWRPGWPHTIGQYVGGSLSEKDFLAEAGEGQPRSIPIHQCEAFYYVGLVHLVHDDLPAAREFFARCTATTGTDLLAFSQARAELARLQTKP